MKQIFESGLNSIGNDWSAEKVYVYALENEDEFWELEQMSHAARCKYFDVYEEYGVAPGSKYYRYEFDVSCAHVVVIETVAYNV